MADEAKKALQAEVMAVKQKWGDEIKLSKAKDGPRAPLPISIQRSIETPADAAAYDIVELKVKLWLDSLDVSGEPPVRVEVDPVSVTVALASKIAERVGAQWQSELQARGLGKGWLLEKMLSWCESKFVELINLEPACLDMYMGEDANGMTMRRFALVEKTDESAATEPAVGEPDDASSSDEASEESEDDDVRKERERLERINLKAEAEADRLWREERRREFEALGEDAKRPTAVSKKEQQAAIKAKQDKRQGVRTAKTGSKANKFDAEAAGKKANKKNGLLH
mmetsp:Transcript_18592/g.37874  ORF Transcript_18592/g.37874 Transcript_18592/m.37874 type:complete len:283 (+) Transcript_18592:3-851(+)